MPVNNPKNDLLILTGLSLSLFLYFMVTAAASGYGYFIDELYYIACAKHLAFGYIDHPPLSVALLALNRWLLGDAITAIRILPALAASANVFMAGMVARRLGGTRGAMILTALAVIAMPVFQVMSSFYSMNAFEPLVWTVIIYFVIRLVQEDNPKLWLIVGALMGLGLEMKHTMALYGVALIVGMAITGARARRFNNCGVAEVQNLRLTGHTQSSSMQTAGPVDCRLPMYGDRVHFRYRYERPVGCIKQGFREFSALDFLIGPSRNAKYLSSKRNVVSFLDAVFGMCGKKVELRKSPVT